MNWPRGDRFLERGGRVPRSWQALSGRGGGTRFLITRNENTARPHQKLIVPACESARSEFTCEAACAAAEAKRGNSAGGKYTRSAGEMSFMKNGRDSIPAGGTACDEIVSEGTTGAAAAQ